MTGYTVHTGATKKFVAGWDRVFGEAQGKGKARKSSARSGKARSTPPRKK